MASIIEQLRNDAVSKLFTAPSMEKAWKKWHPFITNLIGSPPQADKIFDLGDHLREIMFSAYVKIDKPTLSETQSMKSRSGALWESLLAWYCNLCLIGTRSVVIKKSKSLVPSQFLDAITADYGTQQEDSEADLIALTFPNNADFTSAVDKISKKSLEKLVDEHFKDFELGVISCKTPWNDFTVIPQHWNMVYNLAINNPDALEMKIGINDWNITSFKKFFYAFATLPSQKPEIIKSTSLPVVRLKKLSGGNFWGLSSKKDIAKSMKEIFKKNFSSSIGDGIESNLKKELPKLKTDYSYFGI